MLRSALWRALTLAGPADLLEGSAGQVHRPAAEATFMPYDQ
ncbi:hypothetical protein ABZS66_22910 [Dactylosporangium sp. NPDC005572]